MTSRQPQPVPAHPRQTHVTPREESARAAPRARRETDVLALGVALLCVVLGLTSRQHLNADGVSYLDLALRLRDGDWSSFVQGYWSPLYPSLLALAGVLSASDGAPSLPVVHALNVLIAIGAVGLLWRTLRRRRDARLARLGFAAFLLAGTRPPRIGAVTPDLLLVLVMTVVALESLEHGGRRWMRLGLALGLAFLTKTSTWPWLIVALLLWMLLARRVGLVRPAARSAAVAVAVALLWIVPLSVTEGRPSLGSTGRLNWCWYLADCDSRSPDTHRGDHAAYRAITGFTETRMIVADFGDGPWTYAPWSDPTTWARGVRSAEAHAPRASVLLDHWSRNTVYVVGLWLAPLLLGVMVPAVLMTRTGSRRFLAGAPPAVLLTIVIGEIGILQFIAVHVEPRLIAPFALLMALGMLWWRFDPEVSRPDGGLATSAVAVPRSWPVLSALGLLVAVPFVAVTLRDQIRLTAGLDRRLVEIDRLHATAAAAGFRLDRIGIVGPALPHLADAWRVGGRIVAQVPPASAEALSRLPAERVRAFLVAAFAGRADAAWVNTGGDAFQMLEVDGPVRPAGSVAPPDR